MLVLQKLNLPTFVKSASIRTKYNGSPLEWETCNKKVQAKSPYKWTLGHKIDVERDGNICWSTWTVENNKHVLNFICILDNNGKLIKGSVNCFVLGFIDMDQNYIDHNLTEFEENPLEWEEVVLDAPPPYTP